MPECPICGSPVQQPKVAVDFSGFDCPRCGRWSIALDESGITSHMVRVIDHGEAWNLRRRSRLSHVLRNNQQDDKYRWTQIPNKYIDIWRIDEPLPAPPEQLDRLIVFVGDKQHSPSEAAALDGRAVSALIGTYITRPPSISGLVWLTDQPCAKELLRSWSGNADSVSFMLTMEGWLRYAALKKGISESRKVLMAMKFGDEQLDRVVSTCFAPAVKRTGFELGTVIDGQPAGLIDDQLRVALRTSRFVVADLTHRNNGAYWEAGFAEGLGRPVIYTCRAAEWAQGGSHFDTNHLVTVIWDPNDLQKAADQLTATIRATLPDEAAMED